MSKQNGAILVIILLFLSIVSCLVISTMNDIFLETKINHYSHLKHSVFQIAETVLTHAEQSINNVACQSQFKLSENSWRTEDPWPNINSCSGKAELISYDYFIEKIATVCTTLLEDSTPKEVTFFRLTVRAKQANNPTIASSLQSTYALVSPKFVDCTPVSRGFKAGRQSWLELV